MHTLGAARCAAPFARVALCVVTYRACQAKFSRSYAEVDGPRAAQRAQTVARTGPFPRAARRRNLDGGKRTRGACFTDHVVSARQHARTVRAQERAKERRRHAWLEGECGAKVACRLTTRYARDDEGWDRATERSAGPRLREQVRIDLRRMLLPRGLHQRRSGGVRP